MLFMMCAGIVVMWERKSLFGGGGGGLAKHHGILGEIMMTRSL